MTGAAVARVRAVTALTAIFIQKRLETWACVILSRCTVAIERPASLNTPKKLVTVVTIATSPKSRGVSSLARIMVETMLSRNFAPCADIVTVPLEIVCPLRLFRRWSVLKCS
jgi:hypothetical protein